MPHPEAIGKQNAKRTGDSLAMAMVRSEVSGKVVGCSKSSKTGLEPRREEGEPLQLEKVHAALLGFRVEAQAELRANPASAFQFMFYIYSLLRFVLCYMM